MELSRFSTPSMVRSPVRGGVMAISLVAGLSSPLNSLAMGLNFIIIAPLTDARRRLLHGDEFRRDAIRHTFSYCGTMGNPQGRIRLAEALRETLTGSRLTVVAAAGLTGADRQTTIA